MGNANDLTRTLTTNIDLYRTFSDVPWMPEFLAEVRYAAKTVTTEETGKQVVNYEFVDAIGDDVMVPDPETAWKFLEEVRKPAPALRQ